MPEGQETDIRPVRLLNVVEVSQLLQVPVATIYRWRHRGEGPPAIRVGRHLRFDPGDLAYWLHDLKADAAARRRRHPHSQDLPWAT